MLSFPIYTTEDSASNTSTSPSLDHLGIELEKNGVDALVPTMGIMIRR